MKEELKQGIREFIQSASLAEENNLLISACDNYFKALVHALDVFIYCLIGKLPDSHGDRFRILEKRNPELYRIVDGIFSLYRKSYRSTVSKEELSEVKHALRETLRITGLEKEFVGYLEKRKK